MNIAMKNKLAAFGLLAVIWITPVCAVPVGEKNDRVEVKNYRVLKIEGREVLEYNGVEDKRLKCYAVSFKIPLALLGDGDPDFAVLITNSNKALVFEGLLSGQSSENDYQTGFALDRELVKHTEVTFDYKAGDAGWTTAVVKFKFSENGQLVAVISKVSRDNK